MLSEFWDYLKDFNLNRDLIIGHNILGFDLPFYQKTFTYFGVEQTVNFDCYKYQKKLSSIRCFILTLGFGAKKVQLV